MHPMEMETLSRLAAQGLNFKPYTGLTSMPSLNLFGGEVQGSSFQNGEVQGSSFSR